MSRQSKNDDPTAPDFRWTSDGSACTSGRQSPPSLYKHLQKHYLTQFNDRPSSSDLFSDVDRRLIPTTNSNTHTSAGAAITTAAIITATVNDESAKSSTTVNEDEDELCEDVDDLDLEMHSFDTFYKQPSHLFMLSRTDQGRSVEHMHMPDLSPYVPDLCVGAIGSAPVMKCCICTQHRSAFFCDYCVRNGDFTSSRPNEVIKERFAEKKLRFFELKRRLDSINEKLEQRLNGRIEANRLRHELQMRQSNLQLLSDSTEEVQKEFKLLTRQARDLNKQVPIARSKNKSMARKLQIVTTQVDSRSNMVLERKQQIAAIDSQVERCARERIAQLIDSIFPIKTANPEDQSDTDQFNSCETSPLLTFSGDSATESGCERDDNYFKREPKIKEERLSIVQSWLPVHGDYSAYLVCGKSLFRCLHLILY
jgi:hypothetical protein